jgi:hypothetical protein
MRYESTMDNIKEYYGLVIHQLQIREVNKITTLRNKFFFIVNHNACKAENNF